MGLYTLKVSDHAMSLIYMNHLALFIQLTSFEMPFHFIFVSLAREILPLWDKQIQSICYQVNGVIEKIGAAEPEWLAKTLDEEMSS